MADHSCAMGSSHVLTWVRDETGNPNAERPPSARTRWWEVGNGGPVWCADLVALPSSGLETGGQVGTRPRAPLRLSCRAGSVAQMSGLWTPDGARSDSVGEQAPDDPRDAELEDAAELLAETRQRLAEVPAEVVVVNHAMGLYELGAIHLSSQPAQLAEAALAIDAFGCLVEGLGERLGPDAATLQDALSQIRLAFVQIKGTIGADAGH